MDTLLVLLKLWQMAKNKVSIRVFPSAFALCGGKPSNTQTNAKIFLCSFLTKFLVNYLWQSLLFYDARKVYVAVN